MLISKSNIFFYLFNTLIFKLNWKHDKPYSHRHLFEKFTFIRLIISESRIIKNIMLFEHTTLSPVFELDS